jgi:hypothetical protein
MRKIFIVMAVALGAGICAFAWVRAHKTAQQQSHALLETMPELSWLRQELDLSDSQFAEVSKLHAEYLPKCAAMCQRIAEAHERLEEVASGQSEVNSELSERILEHAKIHAECQQEMLEHLYETSRLMNKEQAARYLEVMLPYALDFSHSEPEKSHGR